MKVNFATAVLDILKFQNISLINNLTYAVLRMSTGPLAQDQ